MTRTIDVTGSYVVGKADDLRFLGEPAFNFMGGDTPPRLVCAGTVTATGRSVDMFGVVTDESAIGAAGAQVVLKESAEFRVHSVEQGATGFLLTMDDIRFSNAGEVRIGGATFAIGLQMEGAGVVAQNSGTLEVSSHTASGGVTLGASSRLVNSGDIVVTAATEGAYGVLQYADSRFDNSGLLLVNSELSAIGVQMSPGGVCNNDGQIKVISQTGGGLGMTFWDTATFHNSGDLIVRSFEPAFGINLGGSAEITNEGRILVTSSGDLGPSVAVWGVSAPLMLDNSGLIRADVAVLLSGETVGASISNSGKILGDLLLSDGGDVVINDGGVIRGDVELAAGDDTFRGFGGKLVGEISGGDGDDRLELGTSENRIIGGEGSDTMTGGAGADVFVYAAASESSGIHLDVITDLDVRGDDIIDLSAIDANSGSGGDQGFHLVGSLSGEAGELALVYHAQSDVTFVLGDVDGDGQADLRIVLEGDHSGFEGFVL
jgi:Ca2+-binding RTX toxin-like protein